ncbi:hypothetical protein L914_21800, partial [Phytophthora nicotianae]
KLDDPMGAFLMWRHHNTQLDLTSSQCSPFSKSKRIDARNSTKSYVAKTDRSARDAEKEERQERDKIRQEEAAAANSRHEQIMETHRADPENSRQNRKAEREDRKAEMEENHRGFDKQMELDRSEARQRHEQMMLLITSMVQKKQ